MVSLTTTVGKVGREERPDRNGGDGGASRRFAIRRNFKVKIPRMQSKRFRKLEIENRIVIGDTHNYLEN